MLVVLFAQAALLMTLCGALTVDPEKRVFRDQLGRQVMLHGVNIVYKVEPYLPVKDGFDADRSLTDEDI